MHDKVNIWDYYFLHGWFLKSLFVSLATQVSSFERLHNTKFFHQKISLFSFKLNSTSALRPNVALCSTADVASIKEQISTTPVWMSLKIYANYIALTVSWIVGHSSSSVQFCAHRTHITSKWTFKCSKQKKNRQKNCNWLHFWLSDFLQLITD